MFFGKHERQLDDKGRLVLPAEWRDDLGSSGVLAPWDGCLALWGTEGFRDLLTELKGLVRAGDADRDLVNDLRADARPIQLDSQGRFVVPDDLRGYGGLTRELLLAGQDDYIQLWDRARYGARRAERSPDRIGAEVARLRL